MPLMTGNVRAFMGFDKWIKQKKNQRQYKNILETLECETQMFLLDLKRVLLSKKSTIVN